MSIIYKYIAVGFLWLLSLISLSLYSYHKGTINERNSIEVKQLKSTINQQSIVINQQQQSIQNSNTQLSGFSEQLKLIQESYIQSKQEVNKYEKLLNNSNRINALFLRSIHALSESSVRTFSNSAGNFNAESAATTYIPISGISDYLLTVHAQCTAQAAQLNSLIDWINKESEIYVKKKILP